VIEPQYSEDVSPGYLHHDSDVVWLDPDLVSSRSLRCRSLIAKIAENESDEDVVALSRDYRGRFALDFAYEEWANSYRDSLHAAYLGAIEQGVARRIQYGRAPEAIALARRALEIDPDAEELERLLLRAYHAAGARAATNEQYSHYAAFMKNELGIEPPLLDDLTSDPPDLR
jgi:DNA-binding SARP family transcriptional activator